MDSLRLILIILGVGVIAVIYLWDRFQKSNEIDKKFVINTDQDGESGIVITAKTEFDDDVTSELSNLASFMGKLSKTDSVTDDEEILSNAFILNNNEQRQDQNDSLDYKTISETGQDHVNAGYDEDKIDNQEPFENIVVFHIVARGNNILSGVDIQNVCEELGLTFGEMDIYHYYDNVAGEKSKPLFSLVNMYEPGKFDIKNMQRFTTRGISVFSSLPKNETAESIFKIMLDTCNKIADQLDATIWGADKQPISEETVNNLYQQLKE